MGARPIALLDGLWFGSPDWHFRRAVGGIAHYGNCVGVPTVGRRRPSSTRLTRANPLVNAMCVGLLPAERVLRAKATGAGNLIVLYGALTGRDGIGGASVLASQDLEGSDEKRPSVQIGDPFRGKALIEVSLDLVERELVVGLAGLRRRRARVLPRRDGLGRRRGRRPPRPRAAARARSRAVGDHDLRVAGADGGGRRARAARRRAAACARWELPCTVIGEVTGHGELRVLPRTATSSVRSRPRSSPRRRRVTTSSSRTAPSSPAPRRAVNDEPKTWIFEQYDQLVGSRTVRRPGLDAAVLRLDGTRGLAVSLDGPRIGERDPFQAGRQAVIGAALNVACAGGEPIALTDCLNFGNPERPEIAWELARAIDGIAEAADELGIPVVSGNVSLYNETGGRPIPPTPVVGCVGLVADVTRIPSRWRRGDRAAFLRGEGAELVRFVWQNAGRFTLAHDGRRARGGLRGAASRPGFACPAGPGVLVALGRLGSARLGRRRRARGRLMCGVFGIRAPGRDVARLSYFGLHALQHRGQESAGIAVSENGRLTGLRDLGLVAQVFDEQKLSGLRGELAIAHTRYSTTGSNAWANAQPLIHHGPARTVALGHNGNLTNADALRDELAPRLGSTSDSEVIAAMIAADDRPLEEAAAAALERIEGAAAVVGLADGKLFAFRDSLRLPAARARPTARRPGRRVRDVRARPGRRDVRARGTSGRAARRGSRTGSSRSRCSRAPGGGALCIFEFFYLARPDTRLDGVEVHGARVRMGERLAAEAPAEADLVLPIPDSGTPAAIGFARASGIPFSEGLIKNRYVHRTFIQPEQGMREQGIRMKFNPLDEVAGQAPRDRRRLDRARLDDAADRADALRRGRGGGARPHLLAAGRLALLLRHRPRERGRDDRRRQHGRGRPGGDRRHLARLPLARGPPGGDRAAGELGALPRVPHPRVPDAHSGGLGEAPLRAVR